MGAMGAAAALAATARRAAGRPLGLRAAVVLAAAAALLAACAHRPTVPAYPFSALEASVFVATPGGLAPVTPKIGPESLAKLDGPAALVPCASVLSANGAEILVAVNRVGPLIIEPDSECRAFRVRGEPRPDPFSLLTAGGAWPRGDGFIVQLYRDPFTLPDATGNGRLGTIVSIDAAGSAQVLAASGLVPETASGFGLFALYPAPQGGWLAELRRDDPDRVQTRYLAAKDPEDPAPAEIQRAAFETALAPRLLGSATGTRGEALRHALAALLASEGGPAGTVMIRARGADGSDQYYSAGASVDDERTLYAWYLDDGRVLVMEPGGQAAIADSAGSSLSLSFAVPVAGAAFTAVAVCRRLVAAAWEAGDFPDLRAAGLVVRSIP